MATNRANRVAVKTDGCGGYVADFYRTHKFVGTVLSNDTEWVKPESANKSGEREAFRQYVIDNSEKFGIEWKPQDMRADNNIRRARYETDEMLVDDALEMLRPQIKTLVDKCKYEVKLIDIVHEDIVPMSKTATGRDLKTMGITEGKYNRSGNWAWADIKFAITLKYRDCEEEIYMMTTMNLVSGQLKKVGMGITEFNSNVRYEIIESGIATAEELDPPKQASKKQDAEQEQEQMMQEKLLEKLKNQLADEQPSMVKEQEKPQKVRKRKAKVLEEVK